MSGEGGAPTVEQLLRLAHDLLSRLDIAMSPSKVARLCRDYVNIVAAKGVPFGAYLANAVALDASQRREFDEVYHRYWSALMTEVPAPGRNRGTGRARHTAGGAA